MDLDVLAIATNEAKMNGLIETDRKTQDFIF